LPVAFKQAENAVLVLTISSAGRRITTRNRPLAVPSGINKPLFRTTAAAETDACGRLAVSDEEVNAGSFKEQGAEGGTTRVTEWCCDPISGPMVGDLI
jgi:hypothetical protein